VFILTATIASSYITYRATLIERGGGRDVEMELGAQELQNCGNFFMLVRAKFDAPIYQDQLDGLPLRTVGKWVDTLGHSKPTVTYKSASHLQDAYKSMKRRAVRQATLRPHTQTQTIRELRSSHTNREAAVAYLQEFAQPEPPTVAQPFVDATDTVDQDQAPNYDGDSDEPERAAAHQPRRRKNSGKRCRKCGKEYAHKDWKEFHVVTQAPTSGNLRSNDIKIDEHCTVPIDQYEPGFPFLDLTKRMPKRKRK